MIARPSIEIASPRMPTDMPTNANATPLFESMLHIVQKPRFKEVANGTKKKKGYYAMLQYYVELA